MPKFFNKFPKMWYDYSLESKATEYNSVVDILFRVNVLRKALEQTTSYYDYLIEEGETPEILADRIYDDPELHWIILYANDILDPQYDWPLDGDSFANYIICKYGSIESAQTTYSHWEKVTTRIDSLSGIATVTKARIPEDNVITADPSEIEIEGETYPIEHYDSLAESVVETYNLPDGTSCEETITKNRVTNYDYENDLNDAKRAIKIINPGYISQILSEFEQYANASFDQRVGIRALN